MLFTFLNDVLVSAAVLKWMLTEWTWRPNKISTWRSTLNFSGESSELYKNQWRGLIPTSTNKVKKVSKNTFLIT